MAHIDDHIQYSASDHGISASDFPDAVKNSSASVILMAPCIRLILQCHFGK